MMQLPRGTFREIRKNTTVGNVLEDLVQTKFSGICNISSHNGSGTLVYHAGTCILVKFHGKPGDTGWDELQKCTGEVDAALSTLDEAQVRLSLEFNKTCRLVKGGKQVPSKKSTARAHPGPAQKAGEVLRPETPVRVLSGSAPPDPPPGRRAVPEKEAPPGHPHLQGPPPSASRPLPSRDEPVAPSPDRAPEPPEVRLTGGPGYTDESARRSDRDSDSLDIQDLENVTDKIRNDCKTMIRQLNLEHLMER